MKEWIEKLNNIDKLISESWSDEKKIHELFVIRGQICEMIQKLQKKR
jgi:hypothetical protein